MSSAQVESMSHSQPKVKDGGNVARLQNIASEIASNMSASGHDQSYLQSKVSTIITKCGIEAPSYKYPSILTCLIFSEQNNKCKCTLRGAQLVFDVVRIHQQGTGPGHQRIPNKQFCENTRSTGSYSANECHPAHSVQNERGVGPVKRYQSKQASAPGEAAEPQWILPSVRMDGGPLQQHQGSSSI